MPQWVANTNGSTGRQMLVWAILIVCIALAFLNFSRENFDRVVTLNASYAADAARQKARYIDEVLVNAQNSIRQMAFWCSQYDILPKADGGRAVLQKITANSPFDHLEFVDSVGLDRTAPGGMVDVSDRTYFLEGMKGNSGIDVVFHPRVTNGTLVMFYAPVYQGSKIIGVLVGHYREQRMQEILETYFFGKEGKAYLCMADGTVISATRQESGRENMLAFVVHNAGLRPEEASAFAQSFADRQSYGCMYDVPQGRGNFYSTPVSGTDWMLIQSFPPMVTESMIQEANAAGIRLELLLVLVFALYILGMLVRHRVRNRHLVQEKRKMENIVGGVTALFSRFTVVDLDEDTYVYLDSCAHDVPRTGQYSELLKYVSRRYVSAGNAVDMPEVLSSQYIRTHLAEDIPYLQYDYQIRLKEGLRWENISIICLERREDKPAIILLAVQDMTVLKEEEIRNRKALQKATAMAEAANNAKTAFLFNMSHDIRTPMNAIIGFTELLEKYQDDAEKRADYLKKIHDSNTVLLSIINNVLEMARIEKGIIEVEEVAWSTEQFNDMLYSVFQEMMRQKNIEFTGKITVDHPYVFCDPSKLREVFINILSNAYKYTNPGGRVTMDLEEIPSHREGYALYRTTITDTGVGMTREFLPHIFEEFTRERSATEAQVEGTGLGMPIVKRLVEFMEGTIVISSQKNVGTTCIVTIPHRIAAKADLVEQRGGTSDPEQFRGKRILLAEDNDLNAEIAVEILQGAGFAVERAEDGRMAVAMVRAADAGYYDAILMDVQMPNMNGYEAARAIRSLPDAGKAGTVILAMTANAFEEDRKEALAAGMNGHFGKPIDVHELMKALSALLR